MAWNQWRQVVQSQKMNQLKSKMMKRLDEVQKQDQKLRSKQAAIQSEIKDLQDQNQSEVSRIDQMKAKHQEMAQMLKEA
jgi:hypothetical protein